MLLSFQCILPYTQPSGEPVHHSWPSSISWPFQCNLPPADHSDADDKNQTYNGKLAMAATVKIATGAMDNPSSRYDSLWKLSQDQGWEERDDCDVVVMFCDVVVSAVPYL